MAYFNYGAAAELFPGRQRTKMMAAVAYIRFAAASAAANAWLAAISCSRSAAGSAGMIGGPDLLRWSCRKTLRLLISFRNSRVLEPSCGRC
jgi:hypothetical protein